MYISPGLLAQTDQKIGGNIHPGPLALTYQQKMEKSGSVRSNRPEEDERKNGMCDAQLELEQTRKKPTRKDGTILPSADQGSEGKNSALASRHSKKIKKKMVQSKGNRKKKQLHKKLETEGYKKKIQDRNGNTLIIQVHRAHNYYR